jgi:hypothetical protein
LLSARFTSTKLSGSRSWSWAQPYGHSLTTCRHSPNLCNEHVVDGPAQFDFVHRGTEYTNGQLYMHIQGSQLKFKLQHNGTWLTTALLLPCHPHLLPNRILPPPPSYLTFIATQTNLDCISKIQLLKMFPFLKLSKSGSVTTDWAIPQQNGPAE